MTSDFRVFVFVSLAVDLALQSSWSRHKFCTFRRPVSFAVGLAVDLEILAQFLFFLFSFVFGGFDFAWL